MLELLLDEHFWVGVAFVVLMGILVRVGVHKLADVKAQKAASEKLAADMLANAAEEAKRMHADAQVKLAEQIERRGVMAERKIAQAEAQAANDVRAAAADLAAGMAEQVLMARVASAKSDPLVDRAIGQLAGRLQ